MRRVSLPIVSEAVISRNFLHGMIQGCFILEKLSEVLNASSDVVCYVDIVQGLPAL